MITLPLSISAGEDFYLPIQYQFEIKGEYFPMDISGYNFEMQIGLLPFNLPPIIDVTSQSGQIIVDGPNGKAEIYISHTLTNSPYVFGNWKYAIKATSPVGLVERLFGGSFEIKGW
jgi:hypothetical protein